VQHIRSLSCLAVGLFALASSASAQDILRLAVAQRGAWESAAPELGQLAGTFKNHGIVLDLVYPSDGDAELPVIAGNADVGLAIGLMRVLRVYAKGAPVRIIGAIRTGSAGYWYVPATSPIKTVKDLNGKTIAYPTGGQRVRPHGSIPYQGTANAGCGCGRYVGRSHVRSYRRWLGHAPIWHRCN
jgi:NitT/TauT family transport system substrate-binding protein